MIFSTGDSKLDILMTPKKFRNEILDLILSPKDNQNDGTILGDNRFDIVHSMKILIWLYVKLSNGDFLSTFSAYSLFIDNGEGIINNLSKTQKNPLYSFTIIRCSLHDVNHGF